MIHLLQEHISWHKFTRKRSSGQITSVLILILVALLIFIMVTLNLGTVSYRATQLANATDAAALVMGSRLASQSNYMWHQNGMQRERCVKGGILGIVLAIVAAVIAVFTFGAGFALLAAVVAGAIGGAIGNFIVYGTPQAALLGAIQGATIGAAIGTGLGIGFAGEGLMAGGLSGITVGTTAEVAASVALTALSAGSAIYTATVSDNAKASAIEVLHRMMSALPQYESLRESVLYTALSLTVDDPTTVPDTEDLDGNGNYTENVPFFLYWWKAHLENVQLSLPQFNSAVEEFLEGHLVPFYEFMRYAFVPQFDRQEVECTCSPGEAPFIHLLRTLYNCGYDTSSWQPGPSNAALTNWNCANCAGCAPPAGYDEIDGVRSVAEEFMLYAQGLLVEKEIAGAGTCLRTNAYNTKNLANSLRSGDCVNDPDWFSYLYCPANAGNDYYSQLQVVAQAAEVINNYVKASRDDQLPACQLKWGVFANTYMRQVTEGGLCQCPSTIEDERAYVNPCGSTQPCYWTDQTTEACGASTGTCCMRQICSSAAPACQEGVYLPNNPCKIDSDARSVLKSEIATVRNFVSNIEQQIINKYFSGTVCNGCTGTATCPNPPPAVTISGPLVSLTGNIHGKCAKNSLGEGTAHLRVYYSYTVSCQCCADQCVVQGQSCDADGLNCVPCDPAAGDPNCIVCDPAVDPTCTPTQSCTCQCTPTVVPGTATAEFDLPAPDIDLNLVGACSGGARYLSKGEFLTYLSYFDQAVDVKSYSAGNDCDQSDTFATINEDWTDEFKPVTAMFCSAQKRITDDFLPAVVNFANDLAGPRGAIAVNAAGSNTYDWTDSRGYHAVSVDMGPARFAWIRQSKSGNFLMWKMCWTLEDYCDNSAGCESVNDGRTWLTVSRTDAETKDVGSAGKAPLSLKWNPAGTRSMTRRAWVGYSYDKVGIARVR